MSDTSTERCSPSPSCSCMAPSPTPPVGTASSRDCKPRGIPTTALPNPLRGVAHDAAYIASRLPRHPARSLLVGHSYGGAVIRTRHRRQEHHGPRLSYPATRSTRARASARSTPASKDSVLGTRARRRSSTRRRTATRRPSSSQSIRRSSTTRSPPTCRPSRPRCMAATQRPVAELGVLRAVRHAGLEVAAVLDRASRAGDQAAGDRPGPLDGRARRRDDHRGRGLARDHGLEARRGGRGDHDGGGSGRPGGRRHRALDG